VLGCRLFFERRLSVTQRHSCAICHSPHLAFTDGRARALGATDEQLRRGSMMLANVAYSSTLTWADNRPMTLEAQMEQPLFGEHPVEMGLKRDDRPVLAWLAGEHDYNTAFHEAFPAEAAPVTMSNVIKAIAAFERTLISGRSAFDRYMYDGDRSALSAAAIHGKDLFFSRAGCAQCHAAALLPATTQRDAPTELAIFASNGAYDEHDNDRGLMDITGREQDRGLFKVPTLRNVALTAPYMHDGRIESLEAVVDHYSAGGRSVSAARGVRIDSRIRVLNLTAEDKQALVEFLQSLTDETFTARAEVQANECSGHR
jgi:cytochrome c peroxidase